MVKSGENVGRKRRKCGKKKKKDNIEKKTGGREKDRETN